MAAPRMRALVSGSACACNDEASITAATAGKVIMFASLSPTHWPSLNHAVRAHGSTILHLLACCLALTYFIRRLSFDAFCFYLSRSNISPTRCLPPHRVTYDQRE